MDFELKPYFKQQFVDAVSFIKEYWWITDALMTEFFSSNMWENIPDEWFKELVNLSTEELGEIPFGFIKKNWPLDLQEFISRAISFSITRDYSPMTNAKTLNKQTCRGMNPKKKHEVENMASVVNCVHRQSNGDVIVDVGAGKGYLDHVLCKEYGCKVIAVEGKNDTTKRAQIQLLKQGVTDNEVRLVTMEIDESDDCMARFQQLLCDPVKNKISMGNHGNMQQDDRSADEGNHGNLQQGDRSADDYKQDKGNHGNLQQDDRSDRSLINHSEQCEPGCHSNQSAKCYGSYGAHGCLVGLHCCGDLTTSMLKLFTSCTSLSSLVCVSCCYHKLAQTKQYFNYFPMSRLLSDIVEQLAWKPSVCAFRLAAQETRARWRAQTTQDHHLHMKNVAYRGLIELYSRNNGSHERLMKLKRHISKRQDFKSFDVYLDAIGSRIKGPDWLNDRGHLLELYKEHEDIFPYIQIFTVLQVLLQPVIETLIIEDRQQFLLENGIQAKIVPIFDEMISPRNLAIVAYKNS